MRKQGWPFYQGVQLMLEAQQVIGLRMMKLALGGPAAETEMRQMLEEKVLATAEATRLLTAAAARGDGAGGTADAVRMLRRKVRANRRRLVAGK